MTTPEGTVEGRAHPRLKLADPVPSHALQSDALFRWRMRLFARTVPVPPHLAQRRVPWHQGQGFESGFCLIGDATLTGGSRYRRNRDSAVVCDGKIVEAQKLSLTPADL